MAKATTPGAAPPTPFLSTTNLLKWLAVSAIFHIVLVAFLANRDEGLRLTAPKPGEIAQSTTSEARIQEVVQDVREHQAKNIRESVQELQRTQQELAQANQAMLTEYKQLATEMLPTAGSEAQAAQGSAVEAQQAALDAQKAVGPAQQQLAELLRQAQGTDMAGRKGMVDRITAAQEAVDKAQNAVAEAQKSADAAQTAAAQALAFADSNFTPAIEAQQSASQAQREAGTSQQIAVVDEKDIGEIGERIAKQTEAVAKRKEQLAALEASAAKAAERLAIAEVSITSTAATLDEKQQELNTAKEGKDKNAIKNAQNQFNSAKKSVERTNKLLNDAKKSVTETAGKIARAKENLAKAEAEETEVVTKALEQHQKAAASQVAAIPLQEAALAMQQKSQEAVNSAAKASAAASTGTGGPTTSPAIEQAVAQTAPMTLDKPLQQMTFGELYEAASAAEENASEIYREMRAAETATMRKIPLDEARRLTDVAKPERNALAPELFSKAITSPEEAREHSAAVREALTEINSMVSLAREMAAETRGEPISLNQMQMNAQRNAALEAQAEQDYNERAKDLSTLMRQAAGEEGAPHTGGHGPPPDFTLAGELTAAALSANATGTVMTTTAATSTTLTGVLMASFPAQAAMNMAMEEAIAAAEAAAQAGGGGPEGGSGSGAPSINNKIDAIPGRKVMSGNQASPWMFVDSWYIIGPFPNPDRVNIDRRFPPESVIDLDASYPGKNGKMVEWEFVQTDRPMVEPPDKDEYQIYYAYTELWFEEAADRWIAVGSDDYSKLWVEGMLVWKSGEQLKGWNVKEGFRKVHFKKGLNRILYRVENGWRSTQFSLVLNLDPSVLK